MTRKKINLQPGHFYIPKHDDIGVRNFYFNMKKLNGVALRRPVTTLSGNSTPAISARVFSDKKNLAIMPDKV